MTDTFAERDIPTPQTIHYTKWIAITLVWATFFFLTSLAALTASHRLLGLAGPDLNAVRVGTGFGIYLTIAIGFAVVVGFLNRLIDPTGEKRAARKQRIDNATGGKVPVFVSLPGSFASAAVFCGLTCVALNLAGGTVLTATVVGLAVACNLPAAFVGAAVTGVVLRFLREE